MCRVLEVFTGGCYLWRRRGPSARARADAKLQARIEGIHHGDQGTRYTSITFGQRGKEVGVRPSTGSAAACYDNAACQSFFATLECELLNRRRFRRQAEARPAVFEFIEGFYNPHRRHAALDYESPTGTKAGTLTSPKM